MAHYALSSVPMKPTTRKKIKRALARRLKELYSEVFAEELKDPTVRRFARLDANINEGLSGLDAQLRKGPEPTPGQLEKVIRQIREERFDLFARASFMYLAKKFPPLPPGKQPKLTPKQQEQAFAEVHGLTIRKGLSRKEAYRQVASRYDVHWRTIQNLCRKGIIARRRKDQ
jgi:hypothetical protein